MSLTKILCRNKNCKNGLMGKRKKFMPERLGEVVCSTSCLLEIIESKNYKRKREQEIRRNNAIEKKRIFEKYKPKSKWIKEFQTIFNKYIRLRDEKEPCISCGVYDCEEFHAGHYIATTHQYLRFNELNCWKQCSKCNTYLRGNLIPYRINLIKKIGLDAVEQLENSRHNKFEIEIYEIKQQIELYKQKIKAIKSGS